MNEERFGVEGLLTTEAAAFAYPATPGLGPGVLRRLAEAQTSEAAGRKVWIQRATFAALVVATAATVAMLASRDVRDAVADFLGLAVEGEQIRVLPTPPAGTTATPFPTPQRLEEYATPTTYLAAPSLVGFEPALPPDAGMPRGIYTMSYLGVRVLILDYERFALWEVRDLTVEKGVIEKGVVATPTPYPQGPGVFEKGLFDKSVQRLSEQQVAGRPAYWISGGPHFMRFLGPDGTPVAGTARTVERNTLVWRGPGGTNYRLEIDGSLEEALAIANSLP
jgi:hypothetical protein